MAEVIPGIYKLKTPLPDKALLLGFVNLYLVQGDDGYILIDTGWNTEEALESLQDGLAEIGVTFKDITQVISTHIHADHYSMAEKLRELSDAKISIHKLEVTLAGKDIDMDALFRQELRWFHTHGVSEATRAELEIASMDFLEFFLSAVPDITFSGGETVSTGTFDLEVLWTPGHSPGHICLYEPKHKILLSGDHILPNITPHIGLHPHSDDNPLGDYINSLNMLKTLDVNLILPAHENPFTGLQSRIEEIIQHHKLRNLEILETIRSEPKTAYLIATEITWLSKKHGTGWEALASLDKRLAILETIAHLEFMRINGEISKVSKNGVAYYQSQ